MPYKVRDLMVNVIRAGAGGAVSLPADDTTPVPTPITPIAIDASLVLVSPVVQAALPAVKDTLKAGANATAAESLARAGAGFADGNGAFAAVGREVTATLVGAAVIQGRGGAGMPNPDGGGNTLETIPTPITPYVFKARQVLQPQDLPALKARLTRMLKAVETAEAALTPKGKEAAELADKLKAAAAELGKSAAVSA